jgi:hypothetical protein
VTLEVCNEQIPALPITRQFDFGQFVMLFYKNNDPGAADHKVPPRRVEITDGGALGRSPVREKFPPAGGPHPPIPELDAARKRRVDLFDVLRGNPQPILPIADVMVPNVAIFLESGNIEIDGLNYLVTVDDELERTLGAGYSVVVEAASDQPGALTRELLLVPTVPTVTLSAAELHSMIAGEAVKLDAPGRRAELTPDLIQALLDGRDAIVCAVGNNAKPAPVLVRTNTNDRAPIGEMHIPDLAAFLARPQVAARSGMPIELTMTPAIVASLRGTGSANASVGNALVHLTVDSSPASSPGTGLHLLAARHPVSDVGPAHLSLEAPLPPSPPRDSFAAVVIPPPPDGMGLQVAVFIPWRQTWKLKGFARGNLLQSFALAPQEEIMIEVSSWEQKRGPILIQDASESDVRQAQASASSATDIDDIFSELLTTHDYSWQFQGAIDVTMGGSGVTLGSNGDFNEGGANKLAAVAMNGHTNTREATNRATASVRAQRTTTISQASESGAAGRIVRKIRNPNQCHTITYDFFEILAHYDVELDFVPERLRLVATVPNPVRYDDFSPLVVRTHETALMRALIEPSLADGFAALRMTRAYAEASRLVADLALDKKKQRDGLLATYRKVIAPDKKPAAGPPEDDVLNLLRTIKTAAQTILRDARTDLAMMNIFASIPLLEDHRRRFKLWLFVQLCAAKLPGVLGALERLTQSDVVDMDAARLLLAALPKAGHSPTLATLKDLSPFEKEQAAISRAFWTVYTQEGQWPAFSRICVDQGLYVPTDLSLAALCDELQGLYRDWEFARAAYQMETEKEVMIALAQAKDDLAAGLQDVAATADKLALAFPFDDLAHAYERQEALLRHINEYRDHYNYALFCTLPADEQANQIVVASENRLQIGMFERRVVAMLGSKLAVPLTDYGQSGLRDFVDGIVKTLAPQFAPQGNPSSWNDPVVVPTAGITMLSRLGECTSCEPFLEKSHDLELMKVEALARQAVAEAARREARLAEKDFSDPTAPTPV